MHIARKGKKQTSAEKNIMQFLVPISELRHHRGCHNIRVTQRWL